MNNIFLFDIDGTLSENGIIPPSAKQALRILRENKNIVLLATGRCLGQMENVLKEIEVDGAILNNGALAIIHNEIVFSSPINKENIFKLLDKGLHIGLLSKDRFVRIEDNEIFDEFIKYFNIPKPIKITKKELESLDVFSIGVYDNQIDSIPTYKFPDLRFVKVCPIGYEVMNFNIHKASSINNIKDKYPGYKIIAFGDNYNDIELLKMADISIVMGNANEDIKKYATFVTKSVLDDGIFYALKEYLRCI